MHSIYAVYARVTVHPKHMLDNIHQFIYRNVFQMWEETRGNPVTLLEGMQRNSTQTVT